MRDGYDIIDVTPGFRRSRFSRREIIEIGISVLVLSLAFTIVLTRGNWTRGNWGFEQFILNFLFNYGICLVLVTLSFIPHELGHKFVAQKYGAWSEYRMSGRGLLMSVIISLLGFLIAAPGAVYINGRINEKQNGVISAAGPMVNIVISGAAIVCLQFVTGMWTVNILNFLAYLNAMLAIFNLIPMPPLDGSKVIRWSIPVWITMLAAGALEFLFTLGILF